MTEVDLISARETIALLTRQVKEAEYDTRKRIEQMTGLDGDFDLVSRREWGRFYEQMAPTQRQLSALIRTVVDYEELQALPPMLVNKAAVIQD